MQKMTVEYAQRLLNGGYVFGNKLLSKTKDLLIVLYEDEYSFRVQYYGTKLVDGNLQPDEKGYIIFTEAEPIIDETTKWIL